MPNVAELLDRESQTVDLEHGDFERLLLRRERKQRNRRIGAGALALALVVLGIAVLLRAFQPEHTPADRPVQPSPMALGALAYGVDGDIYVADWDGANPIRIANGRPPDDCGGLGEYWGEGPIWSPDGRYLAYRHTDCDAARDAWWDVVISDSEGNVVASFPSEGWLISWSPDSTRVAVWVTWGETIGVYGLDGERQTVLTLPPGLMAPGDYDPVWSRDAASLLVPHGVVIPLDGSTPHKLPPDDPRSKDASYSPDGSRVAYFTRGSLVVAAADGSQTGDVIGPWSRRGDQSPVWSPTGDRIAFAHSETGGWPPTELRVIDVATGTVTSLAGMGGSDHIIVIAFSPEGDRILFSRTEDGGTGVSSLWSIHADGSDPRRLVSGTAWGDWLSPSQTH
jgi:dipeptidyl aminopeptidase/acylaminoacyl peptidase